MKKLLLCLLFILVPLFSLCNAVSAQNTNTDAMTNEELMILLQQIMQKLEMGEAPAGENQEAESADPVAPEVPAAYQSAPEPADVPLKPSLHENKRLFIGDMPDYYFYRAPVSSGEDEGEDPDPGKPTPKKTPEQCENYCAYEACEWGDNKCYWYCYFPCLGQPIPDSYK